MLIALVILVNVVSLIKSLFHISNEMSFNVQALKSLQPIKCVFYLRGWGCQRR